MLSRRSGNDERRGLIAGLARRLGHGSGKVASLVVHPIRLLRGKTRTAGPRFTAAEMAAEQGLTALSRALSDPDPSRRILALEIIARFSEDRANPLLSGVLQDPDPGVRAAAAVTAGRLGASAVVFMLILMLDDLDDEVRAASRGAIEDITGHPLTLTGPLASEDYRREVAELKRWWKQQRFEQLAAEARIELEPLS